MDPQRWTLFVMTAAALIVVPGPDWAFTVAAASHGRRTLSAVSGIATGYLGLTALVAAGVGALVASSPVALTALTVGGAAYLFWLGCLLLAGAARSDRPAVDGRPTRNTFVEGAAVSALNPKGLLLMVAVLPQFAEPGRGWPTPVQVGVLGLTFTAACAGFYLALGACVRRLTSTRPARAHLLSRLAGAAMVGVAVVLVVERMGAGIG